MSAMYFEDDARIIELAPLAKAGDQAALDELRVIYERGEFDPGFGRELDALLARSGSRRITLQRAGHGWVEINVTHRETR